MEEAGPLSLWFSVEEGTCHCHLTGEDGGRGRNRHADALLRTRFSWEVCTFTPSSNYRKWVFLLEVHVRKVSQVSARGVARGGDKRTKPAAGSLPPESNGVLGARGSLCTAGPGPRAQEPAGEARPPSGDCVNVEDARGPQGPDGAAVTARHPLTPALPSPSRPKAEWPRPSSSGRPTRGLDRSSSSAMLPAPRPASPEPTAVPRRRPPRWAYGSGERPRRHWSCASCPPRSREGSWASATAGEARSPHRVPRGGVQHRIPVPRAEYTPWMGPRRGTAPPSPAPRVTS